MLCCDAAKLQKVRGKVSVTSYLPISPPQYHRYTQGRIYPLTLCRLKGRHVLLGEGVEVLLSLSLKSSVDNRGIRSSQKKAGHSSASESEATTLPFIDYWDSTTGLLRDS
ncbi:hypothetical protein Y1Q_0002009 [Alligator mississippiensis]|uniref:Uncharacterized protein n=1 Tax=Alligator mississippiensis TaxID=8496 RepID=A0A151MNR9_ALLMI|nr:hypothetical protein Y1Q_0002009 [Alligator mississippiensis]